MRLAKNKALMLSMIPVVIAILIALTAGLLQFKKSIEEIQKNIGTVPNDIRYQLHQSIHQVTLLEQEARFRMDNSLPFSAYSLVNRTEQLKFRVINIRAVWGELHSDMDKSHLSRDIDNFETAIFSLQGLLEMIHEDETLLRRQVFERILKLKVANAAMYSNGSKFLKEHTDRYVAKLSSIATAINILIFTFVAILAGLSYSLSLIFRQRNLLKKLSREDSLTRLFNRRQFNIHLQEAVTDFNNGNTRLTLMVFDVDYFKLYNDSLGHIAGDQALKSIAQELTLLKSKFPDVNFYRVGGEEFACISVQDDIDDQDLAEDIRRSIEELHIGHQMSDVSDSVTVSIGIVEARQLEQVSTDSLYSAADQALYKAKKEGRNQTHQYEE